MKKVGIVTDSGSGMPLAQAKELGVGMVSIPFTFDNDSTLYYDDINITREEFFTRLKNGEMVHTSQPIPVDVLKVWDEFLRTYDEIVYIPLSSGLSGSCQSASMLSMDYDGRVEVVDNQRVSITQYRSVLDALEMAQKGWTAKEIREKLLETKGEQSIYIMVDTLVYLKKGGRITPAAAALGTMLKLKPVLKIFGDKLDSFAKARNVTAARKIMIDAIRNDMANLYGGEDKVWLYAVQSDSPLFDEWRTQVRESFPAARYDTDALLPNVINCHIGEGALAIACSKILDIEDRSNRTDC